MWQANTKEDVSSVFCSELVAWIYKQLSLFSKETISSNWVTSHWSHFYGDDDANAALLSNEALNGGASLDPEVELAW